MQAKYDASRNVMSVDLPLEVTDEIVAVALRQSIEGMKQDLQNFYEGNEYLHPEDVGYFNSMIYHMEKVLSYYSVE